LDKNQPGLYLGIDGIK
jgi:hypothetical protein